MDRDRWSPFDPKWYSEAFDKYTSTATQLFNTNDIIEQGYHIPDKDGSRSSIFRNEAVLNNSFNEEALRNTLKDIYLNNSHKLKASNHDSCNFYQWNGRMKDLNLSENVNICDFVIPIDQFIPPSQRDKFKLSQFYRKWIDIQDILNNWDIFKFACLLFINKRIYSEYLLRIDDHEVTIRFDYYDHWVKNNYPVYIYKFDTNFSCRIKISRELCNNQWNWLLPINYINDSRITNVDKIMVAINRIADINERNDNAEYIDALGDNLEFLNIKDGYINLNSISDFNKKIINSEAKEYLWMSIMVPKYFHEYPVLLPTDVIYRPYQPNFQPVSTMKNYIVQHAKINKNDTNKQVYVDINGHMKEKFDGWTKIIRPIVLSDAFVEFEEPYESLVDYINNLRDLTIKGADIIEEFRFYLLEDNIADNRFNDYIDKLLDIMEKIHQADHDLLDVLLIEYDQEYEKFYKRFIISMDQLRNEGSSSDLLDRFPTDNIVDGKSDFWFMISPCIFIPRELADSYYMVNIIHSMSKKVLWEEKDFYKDKVRFQRPIENSDFWTFEYFPDDKVWRPSPLIVENHFPDVYLLRDGKEKEPTLNRIFKSFFFYNDTMNVLDQYRDIIGSSPIWDNDIEEYHFDQVSVYRDIFMEKFYWMGIKSIYKGLLTTNTRWQIIEYIIDNPSYERFNKLFLETMDPYFKLGIATYLKSEHYEFPFDDAISKLEESINEKFLGYKRITNYEMYLNKTWIPSYFDYIVKIMDDYDYSDRWIKRPRSTFDIKRFLPILQQTQIDIKNELREINLIIKWILEMLDRESYNLNISNITDLKEYVSIMENNMKEVIDNTANLDLDIYSIDDINSIIRLLSLHKTLTDAINGMQMNIYNDTIEKKVYIQKRMDIENIVTSIIELKLHIDHMSDIIQTFDMEKFMKVTNDLETYFVYNKVNLNDKSLLGHINQFNDPWSVDVKEKRNKLFQSTAILYGNFDSEKSYTYEEIDEFLTSLDNVMTDTIEFKDSINNFYEKFDYDVDKTVIDRLDQISYMLYNDFIVIIERYKGYREELLECINTIETLLSELEKYNISDTEKSYLSTILADLAKIIYALSYIAGINNAKDANSAYDDIQNNISKWMEFINTEESVFLSIIDFTNPENKYLINIEEINKTLTVLMEYMDSVNIEYKPDIQCPTYSDIYEIDKIEMVSGGFKHQEGDYVFIKNLGTYQIDSIENNICIASSISEVNYRTTSFRDPCWQQYIYDSITSGDGMGIMIKAISSKHTVIINDEIVDQIIMSIKNGLYLIRKNLKSYNSYNNDTFEHDLKTLSDIKTKWSNILDDFGTHISNNSKQYVDQLIQPLSGLIESCNQFMERRNHITIGELLSQINEFIKDIYKYANNNDLVNKDFIYYSDKFKLIRNKLSEFYGNGTTWENGKKLSDILTEVNLGIVFYKENVLDIFEINPDIENFIDEFNNIIKFISSIKSEIISIPSTISTMIDPTIERLEKNIKNKPELQKDKWYMFHKAGIAESGIGYRVGDIVEIIPQLPTDKNGNEIHDMEDIILNDVILLQVMKVEYGEVVEVEPMMNYAIPYLIWGIRETITRVGIGNGLKIDAYSYEIGIGDMTYFNPLKADILTLPQFNENDLFMYKFENIHDLNIKYDVFLGGNQITNYIHRHFTIDELAENHMQPRGIDAIYINANQLMELQKSKLDITNSHSFIYRLDKLDVKDPGAGYAVGQNIYVDVGEFAIKLRVTELDGTPFKGIKEVALINENINIDASTDCNEAKVINDTLNNIDDEFHNCKYDLLPQEGITKPATSSFANITITTKRYTDTESGDRNEKFLYPDVSIPGPTDKTTYGDSDEGWYQGSRIDNSVSNTKDERVWNGIQNVIPPSDNIISDEKRLPPNQPLKGEYQSIVRQRIHNSEGETNNLTNKKYHNGSILNSAMTKGDITVATYNDIPKHINDYPGIKVGKVVIVLTDETNNNHRTLYTVRTFSPNGYIVYDLPEICDMSWNHFLVDWMNIDCYQDYPTMKAQYPSADWRAENTYMNIENSILEGRVIGTSVPKIMNNTSYIKDITVNDISVFNWTKHEWEDLHSEKWELIVTEDIDNKTFNFKLFYYEDGIYSYDMELFLNKTPETLKKNAVLKKDAIFSIKTTIVGEVNKQAIDTLVHTGRHLRIRKLFPYEQTESYTIGFDRNGEFLGYEMDFKINNYIHFKNELHLEDIKVYNRTAGRYEDILDRSLFEVRFKDDKSETQGWETNTRILQSLIGKSGANFHDGPVWCYNSEYDVTVFGIVTADYKKDGHIITFKPIHFINAPEENIALEFNVFQKDFQTEVQMAIIVIEFITEKVEVFGDGYIHNVINPLAPLPKEFKIISQLDLNRPFEYDIILDKTPKRYTFIEPKWLMNPTFHIKNENVPQDRVYILTEKGRFPLVNPSTNKPTLHVVNTQNGTDVTFMNLYRRYEHMNICVTPYPMRSVYVKRRIPSHGFINLKGKLNKPLNKKYFEFWVNGKLLHDEVTIITPTKLILHGLKSLKNFEIIEINRDSNEYFSDNFYEVETSTYGRPYYGWDYDTYLDAALECRLDKDNYTEEEQEYLLSPIWKQVSEDHPEFKNYPPNVDIEDDVLLRTNPEDYPINDLENPSYQFLVINQPTLEGKAIVEQTLTFRHFGYIPITNQMLIDIMNEVWGDEINDNPYFPEHTVLTNDDWYGLSTRLYDEYGVLVHILNNAAYHVTGRSMLKINTKNKISRIIPNPVIYDLT